MVELKFICAEFQYFSTFNKYYITILVRISHGNRSLTSYELGLVRSICEPLGMKDFGAYNKSHGPSRKIRITQTFTMGGLLGDPWFWILHSTARKHIPVTKQCIVE